MIEQKDQMDVRAGQITTTYRFRLYDKHWDWLKLTKDLFNDVLFFYYRILLEREELLELSSYLMMRELEKLTVGTKQMKKDGKEPPYPLVEFPVLPLYFRRAAINSAICQVRSYKQLSYIWKMEGGREEEAPSTAEHFRASPVYYKGMYRQFQKDSIELKVFNGKKWEWIFYRFSGRTLPEGAKILSPSIVLKDRTAWLHVPVLEMVSDVRTVRERMEGEEPIAAVYFPGNDVMAVCVILSRKGYLMDSYFVRGGGELKAKRERIFRRAEKVMKSRHNGKRWELYSEENRALYQKVECLNEYYAHLVSRRILDFCIVKGIKVIAVPNYEKTMKMEEWHSFKYKEWDWIGRRIIRYLKYKAFQNGIVVSGIRPYHITDHCSQCGAEIRRYNEGHAPGYRYYGGQLFKCPNGHRGNSALNAARNIGLYFFKYYN